MQVSGALEHPLTEEYRAATHAVEGEAVGGREGLQQERRGGEMEEG